MVRLNPYLPPSGSKRQPAESEVVGQHPRGIAARLIESRTLVRRFQLVGMVEAEVEWNASGCFEFIRVNGTKVCSQFASLRSIPRFEFAVPSIDSQSIMQGVVDVSVRWGFVTEAFRLCLDGFPIYHEGSEEQLADQPDRMDLPKNGSQKHNPAVSLDAEEYWWRDSPVPSKQAAPAPHIIPWRPRRPR